MFLFTVSNVVVRVGQVNQAGGVSTRDPVDQKRSVKEQRYWLNNHEGSCKPSPGTGI